VSFKREKKEINNNKKKKTDIQNNKALSPHWMSGKGTPQKPIKRCTIKGTKKQFIH
jgi:hypothetical protein